MMPQVCNLPLTADKLHNKLNVSSGTAAARNMAEVRDQNVEKHQNYVSRSLLEINVCIYSNQICFGQPFRKSRSQSLD